MRKTENKTSDSDRVISQRLALPHFQLADHDHHEQAIMHSDLGKKFAAGITLYLLLSFFLLISFVLAATPISVFAGQLSSGKDCSECHNDIIVENLSKTNVHRPFMELQCEVCHVDDSITFAEAGNLAPKRKNIPEKNIKWFDYTASPAAENWFLIPADLAGKDNLVVSAHGDRGKKYKEILQLPAMDTLPMKANDRQPPVIKSTEVLGIYRGLLISARIGWSTDRMTDSEVRYGIDSLSYSAKKDTLTIEHEIVMQGLKANQKYQYVVMSRDIFGNSVVSESGSFSTEKFSPLPPTEYEPPRGKNIILETEFYRNEDSYLVRMRANQPVTLKIGEALVNIVEEKTFTSVAANNPGHLPMRSLNDISTSVCRKCHAKMFESGNHAVNVLPTSGMIIPADFSTSSAGHITCITCHNPHASNYEYMTVKSRRLELCIGCHKGYDLTPERRNPPMLMANNKGNVLANLLAQK